MIYQYKKDEGYRLYNEFEKVIHYNKDLSIKGYHKMLRINITIHPFGLLELIHILQLMKEFVVLMFLQKIQQDADLLLI